MQDNTTSDFTPHFPISDDERTWLPTRAKTRKPGSPKFPPDSDIDLWLKHNAPLSFDELADIRYVLYHHCSRAEFKVSFLADDQFKLTGRDGTLRSSTATHVTIYYGDCDCWVAKTNGSGLSLGPRSLGAKQNTEGWRSNWNAIFALSTCRTGNRVRWRCF